MPKNRPVFLGVVLFCMACRSNADGPKPADRATPEAPAKAAEAPPPVAPGVAPAALGKPAPDFTLPDIDGRPVRLADFRGKLVVLEWFNPECPFVKASHTKGSLVDAAKKHTADGRRLARGQLRAPGQAGRRRREEPRRQRERSGSLTRFCSTNPALSASSTVPSARRTST